MSSTPPFFHIPLLALPVLLTLRSSSVNSALTLPPPFVDSNLAANVQTRTLTASHPPSDIREVVALIDGVAAGFATWYAPVDRTSTGGFPLPEEVGFEEKAKQRVEENKTDEVRAIEASMDEVFGGLVKKETGRVRREWSQGRGHWYLVSPAWQERGWKELREQGTSESLADLDLPASFREVRAHRRPSIQEPRYRIQASLMGD